MKNIFSSTADAVKLIRELAEQGHAEHWIATYLCSAGVPTLSGRGRWSGKSVWRVCQRHGITLRWRPTAHAINSGSAGVRVGLSAPVRPGQ